MYSRFTPPEPPKISFIGEIQMMMFGLGDCPIPLINTAAAIENIILRQLVMILYQAEEIAEKRGSDGIYPQDLLFLMRKDVHKLNRIINYIGFKDLKTKVTKTLNERELQSAPTDIKDCKRKTMCVEFLQKAGIYLDESSKDLVKEERLMRAIQRTESMSLRSFEIFNQSRQVSFMNGNMSANRLIQWLQQYCPECTPKLRLFSIEILMYLAKETVAHLIDIVLLIRQDKNMKPNDPYTRVPKPHLSSETYGVPNKQIDNAPPITVSEIREVMRRYYSTLIFQWGGFSEDLNPNVYKKILIF